MKAAVLAQLNAPLVVADIELGDLSRGQVLVKMLVSGICGAQLQEIAGHKGNGPYVPHLLGHEGCGIVENVGADVTKVKKGDKVVLHWRKGDGIESDSPSPVFKGKKIQSGKVTTFSEYTIASENRITPVPADTPNDFCALLGCGLSTALGVITNEAKVRSGETVLIAGLGGLGACLIKAARASGAGKVICVDIHQHKEEVAKKLTADFYINSTEGDIKEILEQKAGIKSVDVIIETSGHAQSIANTMPLLAGSGRYIMIGQPKPGESVEIKNANHLFSGEGKSIKATQGGQFSPSKDIPTYVELYKKGLLNIDSLITHRTTLENINESIELMRAGKANRIMIDL